MRHLCYSIISQEFIMIFLNESIYCIYKSFNVFLYF